MVPSFISLHAYFLRLEILTFSSFCCLRFSHQLRYLILSKYLSVLSLPFYHLDQSIHLLLSGDYDTGILTGLLATNLSLDQSIPHTVANINLKILFGFSRYMAQEVSHSLKINCIYHFISLSFPLCDCCSNDS